MGVALRGLHPRVAKELADHRQGHAAIIGPDRRRLARSVGRLEQLTQHRRVIIAVTLYKLGGLFLKIAVDELPDVRRLPGLVPFDRSSDFVPALCLAAR